MGVAAPGTWPAVGGSRPETRDEPQPKLEVKTVPPRPDDVATIDGMIKAFYEVVSGPKGQPRDWARDRTLYIKDIRFVPIDVDKDGKIAPRIVDHQQFVETSDGSLEKGLLRVRDPPRHRALRPHRPRLEHVRRPADDGRARHPARHQLDRALLGRQALVDRQRHLDRRDEGEPDPEGVPAEMIRRRGQRGSATTTAWYERRPRAASSRSSGGEQASRPPRRRAAAAGHPGWSGPPQARVDRREQIAAVVAPGEHPKVPRDGRKDAGRRDRLGRILAVDRPPDDVRPTHGARKAPVQPVPAQQVPPGPLVARRTRRTRRGRGSRAATGPAHEAQKLGKAVEVVERGVKEDRRRAPRAAEEPLPGVGGDVADAIAESPASAAARRACSSASSARVDSRHASRRGRAPTSDRSRLPTPQPIERARRNGQPVRDDARRDTRSATAPGRPSRSRLIRARTAGWFMPELVPAVLRRGRTSRSWAAGTGRASRRYDCRSGVPGSRPSTWSVRGPFASQTA